MSRRDRHPPLERVLGVVDLYAPTASSPYYRIKWVEPNGVERDTTAGRAYEYAVLKAIEENDVR